MYRPGLLACYTGLLTGAATTNFSVAIRNHSAPTNPHNNIMDTKVSFIQAVPVAIEAVDATTGDLQAQKMRE